MHCVRLSPYQLGYIYTFLPSFHLETPSYLASACFVRFFARPLDYTTDVHHFVPALVLQWVVQ